MTMPVTTFVVWDLYVTGYFWTFNPHYITGVQFVHIPIEEFLFFLTTSYTCLFVWTTMKTHIRSTLIHKPIYLYISAVVVPSIFISLAQHLWYTALVSAGLFFTLCMDGIFKTYIYTRTLTYKYIAVIIGFTALFNYYLTARPVVLYNQSVKTNILIGPIPAEDFVYGVVFIISVIILYEYADKSSGAYQKTK
jgi:lycopene cyclase domain-containing protein